MKFRYSSFAHRIDIDALEAAIGFEPIRQEGANDVGYCPLPWGLHSNGDTTGKFAIHRDKRVFNCWVCGGGSLLSLAMHMNEMTDMEATEWLYQFTGSDETTEEFMERLSTVMDEAKSEPTVLPYYHERIVDKWVTDHPWFKERGIKSELAATLKFGFNPSATKYPPKLNGKSIGEPFRGPAIVLPHYWKGKLVGWQNRWLVEDRPKWVAKYTNNPDFPKAETLWGFDYASDLQNPIVVESVPTAAYLRSLGYPSVATFGSSVKDEQIYHLRGFQQGVLLAPDNDTAGEEFLVKLAIGLRRFIPLRVVQPPTHKVGADLGDLVDDPDRVRKLIEEAEDF